MKNIKKIICFAVAIALALSICSCGKTDIELDGMVLSFSYSQSEIEGIEACSSANAALYPDAKVMDYTLKAEGGSLTFIGEDGAYSGSYKEYDRLKDAVVYDIVIGDKKGFASLTEKEYADGTSEYQLLFTIVGHTVMFTSGRTAK